MRPTVRTLVANRRLAEERAWFAGLLATLLEMGIPLSEAVRRVSVDARGRRSRQITRSLATAALVLERGGTLTYALQHDAVFPARWGALVGVAEKTGDLVAVMRDLANLEKATFPLSFEWANWGIAILCVFALVSEIVASITIPTFQAVLQNLNTQLPLATRVFMALAPVAVKLPVTIGLLLIAIGAFSLALPQRTAGFLRQVGDAIASRATALREQAIAVSTIATALRVGMTLPQAVAVAAQSATTQRYTRALRAIAGDTSSQLSRSLAQNPDLFDATLVLACRVAESRETLIEVLPVVSERLMERSETAAMRTRDVTGLVIALLCGACVALLAFGMYGALLAVLYRFLEATIP